MIYCRYVAYATYPLVMGNLKDDIIQMKQTILIGLFFFFIALCFTACGQTNKTIDKKLLVEAKITKGDVFKPEEFQLDLNGQTIKADIYGHLTSGQLNKSIELGKEFYTNKIHFYDNDKQVIIFFEITDDDGSYNEVYNLDKQTLKIIWKVDLWSFNLTVGQSEQEILYLGAGENAYALNIKTGKILWQTVGLYHIHGFNYFEKIDLADNEIRLTGKSYSKEKGDAIKTAVLNKKDGKIWTVK
jgi:hypothetical protein